MATPIVTPAGTLDTGFSTDGKLLIDISPYFDGARAVTLQPDGKIIVAGRANQSLAIARLDADGTLDSTFGSDGIFAQGTDFDIVNGVAVLADGRIVTGGGWYSFFASANDFEAVRVDANGSLDPTFGSFGTARLGIGALFSSASAAEVLPLATGEVVLVGTQVETFGSAYINLQRLTAQGLSDGTFENGISTTGYAYAAALQLDGKIVVAGASFTNNNSPDIQVVRYNADGTLDTTFSGDGIATQSIGSWGEQVYGVAIQADGKIVVAGSANMSGQNTADVVVLRYNTDGSLDTSFGGGDGIVTTDLGSGFDIGWSVALQADGKIVVGGETKVGSDVQFALVRYTSSGALDASFDSDGKLIVAPGGVATDQGYDVVIQPDGMILLVGESSTGDQADFALVRVQPGGLPDLRVDSGDALDFSFGANRFGDPDGDPLTYTASLANDDPLPEWLSFDGATRTFSGAPGGDEIGTYDIKVLASDGGGSASDTFTLTVNGAPVTGTAIADQEATEDQAFSFQFDAGAFTDPNGDTLFYTAALGNGDALPAWLHFDGGSRTFSGTPLNADVATLDIDVIATDGSLSTPSSFSLTVANVNDAPTADYDMHILTAAAVGELYSEPLPDIFHDVDVGDVLTLTATLTNGDPLPDWLTLDSASRTFSGTPAVDDAGQFDIRITVSDGEASFTDDVQFYVDNRPELVMPLEDQTAYEDAAFSFTIDEGAFIDVDTDAGQTLSYTYQVPSGNYPSWLNFDQSTRTFYGTATNADVATTEIEVLVSDGLLTVTDTFVLTVENTNDAPTLAPAGFDQGFGGGGKVITAQAGDDEARAVAVQTDGKIILAGGSEDEGGVEQFSLVRYNTDGSLDEDFGTGGRVTTAIGNFARIQAVAVQDDGKIVVVGTTSDAVVAVTVGRYNADGTLDSTFGTDGLTQVTFSGSDLADSIALQADGRILIGATKSPASGFELARLNNDGSLDTSFDGDGKLIGFGAGYDLARIAVQADGKIVVGGNSASQFVVARYEADGSLDTSFSSDGVSGAGFSGLSFITGDMALQADGRVILFGSVADGGVERNLVLVRFNADGSRDDAFGGINNFQSSFEYAGGLAVQEDGTLWAAVTTINVGSSAPSITVGRYDANGQEDASFLSGNGLPAGLTAHAQAATLLADGTLLVAATVGDFGVFGFANTDFGLARVLPGGLPDLRAHEEHAFSFTLNPRTFDDVDVGDTLTYAATLADGSELPDWLTLDGSTGTFSGTPAQADVGLLEIELTASDGEASVSDTLTLTVENVNDAPVVAHEIPNRTAREDTAFVFNVSKSAFSDQDPGTVLTYRAELADGSELPDWLALLPGTRTFLGTPGNEDVGQIEIRLIASDGQAEASDTFLLSVQNVNDAPALDDPLDDVETSEGSALVFSVPADAFGDDDGDGLVYTARLADGSALPSWLSFDGETREFSGTPGHDELGTLNIRVTAADGTLTASDVFAVDVEADGIVGNASAQLLSGTDGDDTINALGGADTALGGGGDELLDGGTGDDSLVGGDGDDAYYTDSVDDEVVEAVGGGIDTVHSTATAVLSDNVENLILRGTGAIHGVGNGLANAITGNAADNLLAGGDGSDSLDGGLGDDLLLGGYGDDWYVADGGDEIEDEEGVYGGTDTVYALASLRLVEDLENLVLAEGTRNGFGNELGNLLIGNTGANILSGRAGSDTLLGGQGADALSGGAGADQLLGGQGDDVMTGGRGEDQYSVDARGDSVIEGVGLDSDTVYAEINYTLGANVENLFLVLGAAKGTGNEQANAITGNELANTLDGRGGADLLAGGAGNDIYVFDNTGDHAFEAADQGGDLVRSLVSYTLEANIEKLTLLGADALSGIGNNLNNTITGNDGANLLGGSTGRDTLTGGLGNDTLDGGAGADRLTGSGGSDIFAFMVAPSTVDTLTDFAHLTDKIQLASSVFGLAPGIALGGKFYANPGSTQAHDADDRIIYNKDTGNLYYDSDGLGGASSVLIATLGTDTHPTVTAGDIMVVV